MNDKFKGNHDVNPRQLMKDGVWLFLTRAGWQFEIKENEEEFYIKTSNAELNKRLKAGRELLYFISNFLISYVCNFLLTSLTQSY